MRNCTLQLGRSVSTTVPRAPDWVFTSTYSSDLSEPSISRSARAINKNTAIFTMYLSRNHAITATTCRVPIMFHFPGYPLPMLDCPSSAAPKQGHPPTLYPWTSNHQVTLKQVLSPRSAPTTVAHLASSTTPPSA